MAYLSITVTLIPEREGSQLAYVRAQVVPSLTTTAIRGEVQWESFIIDLQMIATASISFPFADWQQELQRGGRVICKLEGELTQSSKSFETLVRKHGSLLDAS